MVCDSALADVQRAIAAWRAALGQDNVLDDAASRRRAETATFRTDQKVHAIVRPASRDEVQQVVRIANECRVAVYPVSRGKNWGYGSSVPVRDACVIDLSRMDHIVDFDERLAYVTIEPGVTMDGLFRFLRSRNSRLMMSVTGSTPETSVLGNVVERGVAVGPYGDRFQNVCALEIVLPTGECVHTGFAAYRNAMAARIHKWGVGPALDGLFTQTNLGIVTQMTLWLRPRPKSFQTLTAVVGDEGLEPLVEVLRELALTGTLQPTFGIWNDYKFLATIAQYPWQRAHGETPLPIPLREEMTHGLGRWMLSAALYSNSARHAAADRKLVGRALARVTKRVLFVDSRRAAFAKLLHTPLRRVLSLDLAGWVDKLYESSPFLGIPSTFSIRQAYWRKHEAAPEAPDPDRDRCGVICCAPALPFDGKHVRAVVSRLEAKSREYGFEPNISLLCVTPRQIDVAALLAYDRDVESDEARALECHDDMLTSLVAEGYLPYRLGIQSMHLLPRPDDDSARFYQTLKRALDPHDVLAPGRHDLRAFWIE